MKIVIIGPAYPYRGGIADTNESFCRSLNMLGHEASIVTFTVQYPSVFFPGKSQFSTDSAPIDITIRRSINSIWPLNWIGSVRKINQLKPDIVVIRYWLPFLAPCLGFIARRLDTSITRVALCDNVVPHEPRLGDRSLTRYFVNSFDGLMTLSKTTLKKLDHFTDLPKTYSPHPINTNIGKPINQRVAQEHLKLDPAHKYLLFFGLVRKYKGLDLTLKALAHLNDPTIKLIIAGEFYDNPKIYFKLIDELNISEQVIVINKFIDTIDIKYYFSACDLIIQTYHTASQSGVTQLAYNFEKPILVTDVGGLSEMIPHGQVGYVSSKDPKQIGSHVRDFFDQDRANGFINNIKKEKTKYTWEIFSSTLIKFCTDLIK